MSSSHPALAHHFEDLDQQHEAAEMGMWLFLITECMLFGGLFLAYLVYRYWYPEGFAAGGHTMDVWLGTFNTAVLLTSSLTMALGAHFATIGRRQPALTSLGLTMLLGLVFLLIKAYEYHHKYEEHLIPFGGLPFVWHGQHEVGVHVFLTLYFVMTGLHAVHMLIGLALVGTLAWLVNRSHPATRGALSHNCGLYWHFIDLVWVYLFPLFYLVSVRGGGLEP
jgi:cytochrome c oxidase subunit 3